MLENFARFAVGAGPAIVPSVMKREAFRKAACPSFCTPASASTMGTLVQINIARRSDASRSISISNLWRILRCQFNEKIAYKDYCPLNAVVVSYSQFTRLTRPVHG